MADREYRIQAPDGSTLRIVGPTDATPDQLRSAAERAFKVRGSAAPAVPSAPPGQIPVDPIALGPAVAPAQSAPSLAMAIRDPVRAAGSPRQLVTNVINTARPSVEALGSAGGAVVGVPLGPLGIVGGAGLGYGAAKTGLDFLDQRYGTQAAPTSVTNALHQGASDVLTGATMEAGGRVVAPMVSRAVAGVAGRVGDLKNLPTVKAGTIAREAAGADLPAVRNALAAAEAGVTPGQATAAVRNPTWHALAAEAAERSPRQAIRVADRQAEESLNALTNLAGGDTAAANRAIAERARKAVSATTTPMREAALNRANLGAGVGEWADAAAKGSLDLGEGARAAKGAAEALKAVGIEPLRIDKLSASVGAVLKRPELAGNDAVQAVVKQFRSDLAQWVQKGGVIDAYALDALRKNSANAAINKLMKGSSPDVQREAAAGVMSSIKPMINEAIEQAGGKGYTEYLKTHADMMQKVAEKKLTGEALQLWKTNKPEFVRLVTNESPDAVEKILGKGNYDIAKELSESSLGVLKTEASKITRDAAVKDQAAKGREALGLLLKQNRSALRLPNRMSPTIALANKSLAELEGFFNKSTMDTLVRAMESPRGAADLLATLPTKERVKVLRVLNDPKTWESATGQSVRSGVNAMLLQPGEPTNALVE